jgi:hypothetical protein
MPRGCVDSVLFAIEGCFSAQWGPAVVSLVTRLRAPAAPESSDRGGAQVYYQRVRQSPDYNEGTAAWVERRKPRFTR